MHQSLSQQLSVSSVLGHRQNQDTYRKYDRLISLFVALLCYTALHCTLCNQSQWEEYTFRLTIRRWESVRYFSLCLLTGPQMTSAHAEPFRAAFILICTSRGWSGVSLDSLHRSPCGPVRASLLSRDKTPWCWFIIQRLFFACGFRDNWIWLLEQPRLSWSSSGRMMCMNWDRETSKTERQRCLILCSDFPNLFYVLMINRDVVAVCSQRPMMLSRMPVKCSKSELGQCKCGLVCILSIKNKMDKIWKMLLLMEYQCALHFIFPVTNNHTVNAMFCSLLLFFSPAQGLCAN